MEQRKAIMKRIGAASILFLGLLACNKKKDDPAPMPVVPVNAWAGGACSNCGFSSVEIAQPVSQGGSASITWQILGDINIVNQIASMGWSVSKLYSGPVVLRGTLTYNVARRAGNCEIPPGTYTIDTRTAGQMQNGFVSVPELVATGPIQFSFGLVDGYIIDPNGDGLADRIGGTLRVLSSSIGPGVYGNPGTNGSAFPCSDGVGNYLF